MPRKGRILLENTPHHIVQRGHNRQAVFIEDADYHYYLNTLREWKDELAIKIYGYCLMTNHVHLIVDPGNDINSMSQLMKRLAGRQTRYVNRLEARSGSLWEGRYKSSPIETERYLLACCRYVDLNPVRAGMVRQPGDYLWSSYRQKAGLEEAGWLDEDPAYQGLSSHSGTRRRLYSEYVAGDVPSGEENFIRETLNRGQLTGGSRFIEEVEQRLGLRVEHRGQGRPRKVEESDDNAT